jgi:hypothetical protein
MSNEGSRPLKRLSAKPAESNSRILIDPLEEAWESARDARDIIRDEQRKAARSLHDYTGEDEDTKRTDVHVHVHQHSQPDIEVDASVEVGPVKLRGLPKWLVVVFGLIAAAATALIAHFAR